MTWCQLSLCALAVGAAAAACALPQIPEGIAPADYYGGFFPTEEWVEALGTVPRDQRTNPFQSIVMVAVAPTGKDAWSSPQVQLTQGQLDDMTGDLQPYLQVTPEDFLGMVPRRNRIAGNARIMPATRLVKCPTGDGGSLLWTPDRPDELRCTKGHPVDVFAMFPPTGVFEISGPQGEIQKYPYHDAADGRRIYLNGEYMDSQRVYHLADAAKRLSLLYRATGGRQYATRAAAILYDFACALPHWPKISRGRAGVAGLQRFRPVDDYQAYSGIWYDKYHSGTAGIPTTLALAYDLVVAADVWTELDQVATGGDARDVIERDLFLYTAKDAVRYDIHHPQTSAALSNYIPYQIRGFTCIGRAVGIPELIHYAYWKQTQLVEKTLMADATFPESPSYARQHIYGMASGCLIAAGYSDPPGFVSTIDGGRFEQLDMWQNIPQLRDAIVTLETMVYPDDNYIMVHDTYSKLVSKGHPAPARTRPLLYPAFGHGVLARGHSDDGDQVQAHLHYSGCWGHDHHDMLNFILWAYRDELISDIGYAHTYRQFSDWSLGHNLVVVDRHNQQRTPDHGNLLGWHAPDDAVQVIEAADAAVYPQCTSYRRALFLVPLGKHDNLVVDIFDVAGGGTHEWMAQGSCMTDQSLEVSVSTQFFADTYADDGKPFTPPAAAEYIEQRIAEGKHPHHLEPGEADPWYGVFRDVQKGTVTGPFVATFTTDDGSIRPLRVHFLQPREADLYTCTVPSLRRCWNPAINGEDHSLVEKFRMPKLVLRRDGENLHSRFVAVWEPQREEERVVEDITDLAADSDNLVALRIRGTSGAEFDDVTVLYTLDPTTEESLAEDIQLRGRYAAITETPAGTNIALYDCTYFRLGDLTVTIQSRPALPLEAVVELGENEFGLRLEGIWPDLTHQQPDSVEFVVVQIGDSQRVCPITRAETVGASTLLYCARPPGFTYDAEAAAEAKDLFSPYLTLSGQATVALPSRVWLRKAATDDGRQVRTTDPITLGSQRVEPTAEWVNVGGL